METLRVASAVAVSLGLPLLASFRPGLEGEPYGSAPLVSAMTLASTVSDKPVGLHLQLPTPDPTSSGAASAFELYAPSNSPGALFEREVVLIEAEADSLDRLWQGYKQECGVTVPKDNGFGREWFALLDHAADVKRSFSRECASVEGRILQSARDVRRSLGEARVAARLSGLDSASEVGLLRWHGLQWP